MINKPVRNPDGTLNAIIQQRRAPFANMDILQVALPPGLIHGSLAGRYFLARCGAQSEHERTYNWSLYARRPLFIANTRRAVPAGRQPVTTEVENLPDLWTLVLPPNADDPGTQWLRTLPAGASLNLIGPLGSGFTLARDGMNLLLIADRTHLSHLLPLIEPALDLRCRITLLVLDDKAKLASRSTLLDLLPLAAELQVTADPNEFWQMLTAVIGWADQLCVAAPFLDQSRLAELVGTRRFRLEAGFAQILVEADLICGVGACLACVVPLANGGLTRACIHGPVLDLTALAS